MAITSDERRSVRARKRTENSYADVTLSPCLTLGPCVWFARIYGRVCTHLRARMHAYPARVCTRLRAVFISQINADASCVVHVLTYISLRLRFD